METPPIEHEGNIIYRKYNSFSTHEYITIVDNEIISSINPDTRMCVDGGIRLYTVDKMDSVIEIILGGICAPLDSAVHLRNPMNYEKAVKILTKKKKTSDEQKELIDIIRTLKRFTAKVCKKQGYSKGHHDDRCCHISNCGIADKDEYLGHHCKLCKAKQHLIDLRDSQILLE